MYSLPPLAPQDSYTLWYTASHSHSTEPSQHDHNPHAPHPQPGQNLPHIRRPLSHTRTPLAKLRADEDNMLRRKENIRNYGQAWIRPPGIPKSLHQLREDKREQEEHNEAMRREQLAQELADAEVQAEVLVEGGGGMGVEPVGEVRDLDDEVPEATGIEIEDETEEEDDEGEEEEEVPRGVLASRMPEDLYREALVRGDQVRGDRFEDEGILAADETYDDLLQEEDLVGEQQDMGDNMDMDMDADLDNEVPEAEGYEHTDTEDELSSSDESGDAAFGGGQPLASSLVRSDGTQNSMDFGSIMSPGSSMMGSSPRPPPPPRGFGRGRRSGGH